MIQRCAWCKVTMRKLGEGNEQKDPGKGRFCGKEDISDGICPDCREKHFPETLRTVQENGIRRVAEFGAGRSES
jgi:hypothetical protein